MSVRVCGESFVHCHLFSRRKLTTARQPIDNKFLFVMKVYTHCIFSSIYLNECCLSDNTNASKFCTHEKPVKRDKQKYEENKKNSIIRSK